MAAPDFSKPTIETLAKRAAYRCTNPDCRSATVGPNTNPAKATLIGEAAHIYGARPASKRYRSAMTDAARAEITNGIWLCRNCHKLIDTDDQRYTATILFEWREIHERFTLGELGNATDRLIAEQIESRLTQFEGAPPIARRIVIDKPPGWEWRLTAELLRHQVTPILRKLNDLDEGLYGKAGEHIQHEEALQWVKRKFAEAEVLSPPLSQSLELLNHAWGAPGEEGNAEEIAHCTKLIAGNLEQILQFKESVQFTFLPEDYAGVRELLKDLMSTLADQMSEIPNDLDKAVSLSEAEHEGTEDKPTLIRRSIVLDVPKNWGRNMDQELRRLARVEGRTANEGSIAGAVLFVFFAAILIWLIF